MHKYAGIYIRVYIQMSYVPTWILQTSSCRAPSAPRHTSDLKGFDNMLFIHLVTYYTHTEPPAQRHPVGHISFSSATEAGTPPKVFALRGQGVMVTLIDIINITLVVCDGFYCQRQMLIRIKYENNAILAIADHGKRKKRKGRKTKKRVAPEFDNCIAHLVFSYIKRYLFRYLMPRTNRC